MGRERRRHRDRTTRLLAFVDAFTEATALGLKEHDRPALAREQMLRRTRSRRGNSKLPPHNPFQQIRIERCVPPPVQIPRYCRLTLELLRHRRRQIHQWCRTVRDTGSPRRLIGRVTQFRP
ncbi:DUF1612 domain-containing protein [Mesorhizobium sp. M1365]